MKRFVELKIKIINLGDEGKTIRANELKTYGLERENLHNHRVNVVRKAARTNLLAYGYLRGKTYKSMEEYCYTKPDIGAILKVVIKFGFMAGALPQGAHEENISDWLRGIVWPSQQVQEAPAMQVAAE